MKSFSLIVFLALCITCQEEPATALTCRETETADSVISRRQWILDCVKTQTSSLQTSAAQLEQKEDIIDECADHSLKLRVTTCEPQLEVYEWRRLQGLRGLQREIRTGAGLRPRATLLRVHGKASPWKGVGEEMSKPGKPSHIDKLHALQESGLLQELCDYADFAPQKLVAAYRAVSQSQLPAEALLTSLDALDSECQRLGLEFDLGHTMFCGQRMRDFHVRKSDQTGDPIWLSVEQRSEFQHGLAGLLIAMTCVLTWRGSKPDWE